MSKIEVIPADALLKATAIICITALEICNLLTTNIDGTILSLAVAVISGLAGYEIGKKKK